MPANGWDEFLRKCKLIGAAMTGGAAVAWFFVQVGMGLQEAKTANVQLKKISDNIETLVVRQAATEAAVSDIQEGAQDQMRRLTEAVAEMNSMQSSVSRHVQDSKETHWELYHRLNDLDHRGAR